MKLQGTHGKRRRRGQIGRNFHLINVSLSSCTLGRKRENFWHEMKDVGMFLKSEQVTRSAVAYGVLSLA
jgi:hypothetical protein